MFSPEYPPEQAEDDDDDKKDDVDDAELDLNKIEEDMHRVNILNEFFKLFLDKKVKHDKKSKKNCQS